MDTYNTAHRMKNQHVSQLTKVIKESADLISKHRAVYFTLTKDDFNYAIKLLEFEGHVELLKSFLKRLPISDDNVEVLEKISKYLEEHEN